MWKFKCLKGKDKWMTILTIGAVCCILAFPVEWISGKKTDAGRRTEHRITGESMEERRYGMQTGNPVQTELECRVQSILEHVDGIGKAEVMIVQEEERPSAGLFGEESGGIPQITGIVICADGGGSPRVQAQICETMEALFGLPAHKIKVLKRVE